MFTGIRTLILVVVIHDAAGALLAQDLGPVTAELEARIPQLMEAQHVPGLSMVLIRDNRVVWKKAFGVRAAGKPEPVDDETIFEAASMSKPLYSYAVLKLVESGVLDLDRPLDSYLPGPYLPDEPLAGKITARMVLLHRSGLPNWRQGGWLSGKPLRIAKQPDTCFTYSGEGFTYLIMTNSSNGRKVWEAILAIIDAKPAADPEISENKVAEAEAAVMTWDPQLRTIRYDYRLMNTTSKPATKIDVYVPLPLESPRQQIHYLHLPKAPPHRIITDRHGQRLAHYSVDRLEPGQWLDLGYVVGITLKAMRCNIQPGSAAQAAVALAPADRELYLKPEVNYSMDSEVMRTAAAALVAGAKTDLEKLTRIHDYVIGKIRYVRDDTWDPAAVVLARGTGSCSEYNYVLSGLCRLAGLPTRCTGGSTNGLRPLPTTDTVFHRWTEVFLSEYGWFPADCSRDANPIRGPRSHFGRLYVDVLVWCRQAGGEDDSLGWDYRAKAHVAGDDPGVRETHRTRWFDFYPEKEVQAAYAWFVDGTGAVPRADLLECALLRADQVDTEKRLRMIHELAVAGRNGCLRQAAILPEADQVRTTCVRALCASSDLADTLLDRSRDLYRFRNWFKSNEARLVPTGDGRFKLAPKGESSPVPTTTAPAARIWRDLVPEVVGQLGRTLGDIERQAAVIMPVTDQTLAGLGENRRMILASFKQHMAQQLKVAVLDEHRFDHWMAEQGPGSGEYWILANGSDNDMPRNLRPDMVLVPVCITSKVDESVLYQLEVKTLEVADCAYHRTVAQVRQTAVQKPTSGLGLLVAGGDAMPARWEHDLVGRHGYEWPLAGVRDVLSAADAAFCNLECCVSLRGEPADKGERCPFYYRARPEMLRCLTQARSSTARWSSTIWATCCSIVS